jgi:hypothetical protein
MPTSASNCNLISPFPSFNRRSMDPPYTVQYRCQHDTCAWLSEVWNVHMRRKTASLGYPPLLRVLIYHDESSPMSFCVQLIRCVEWSVLLQFTRKNGIVPKTIARRRMSIRNIEVLRLALTKIGNCGVDTAVIQSAEETIWKGFLDDCRRWESCQKRQVFARSKAERRLDRIHHQFR